MSLKDEFRKFIHPYDEEDEPEEYQEEERPERPRRDEERRSDDRRSKVVNINSAGQLKVVVMNMENTDPDIARRLLDFVSGVAYATSGNVKRVAAKTYIVTPYSVDLMGDLIDGLENSGLYM